MDTLAKSLEDLCWSTLKSDTMAKWLGLPYNAADKHRIEPHGSPHIVAAGVQIFAAAAISWMWFEAFRILGRAQSHDRPSGAMPAWLDRIHSPWLNRRVEWICRGGWAIGMASFVVLLFAKMMDVSCGSDRVGQEATGQWRLAQVRGKEPQRVHSYAVPLGASLSTRLAYFAIRFLRRPQEERSAVRGIFGAMAADPDNMLNAIDAYAARPAVRERQVAAATLPAPTSGAYPARPAKRAGVVSCNTRCVNGDCWRTYDDGHQVHFQAKRVFDSLSGDWKWDGGGC